MPGEPRARGFTLLEALIAFAIAAGGFAVLAGAFGDGLRGAGAGAARLALVEAAQSRLATVGASLPLSPGTREGRDGEFAWRLGVHAAAATANGGPRLYDIALRVEDGQGRGITLVTQRVAP